MDNLTRIGFSENCIVETILVTMNENGVQNPAPMGVTRQGDILLVKPYKTSQTHRNLQRGGTAYINVTDDPLLFLNTAFKDEIEDQVHIKEYELVDVDAVIPTEIVDKREEHKLYSVFQLKPHSIKIINSKPTVFSRGRSMAIEAIIHTTRIQVFQSEKRFNDVQRLVEKVKTNILIVKKVSCEDSVEVRVIKRLVSLMRNWGVEW